MPPRMQRDIAGRLVDGTTLELIDLVDENRMTGPQCELSGGHPPNRPSIEIHSDAEVALHEHEMVHDYDICLARLVDRGELSTRRNPRTGRRADALRVQRQAGFSSGRIWGCGIDV